MKSTPETCISPLLFMTTEQENKNNENYVFVGEETHTKNDAVMVIAQILNRKLLSGGKLNIIVEVLEEEKNLALCQ